MLAPLRRAACSRPRGCSRTVPSAFVPDEDEGYFISVLQAPAGASLEYTTRHRQAGRGDPLQGPRHPRRLLGGGLQLQRRRAEQRPDLHAAQGLRRAQGQEPLARGRAQPRARADDGRSPGALVIPFAPPGHPGPVRLRRLPVRAARPDRRRHLAASPTRRRPHRRGQPERPGGGPVLELPRQRPAAAWSTSTATRPAAWTCRCTR